MAGSSIWAPVGDKGPTGDPGPQGPVGPVGPQGAAGPDAALFAQFLVDLANTTDKSKGISLVGKGYRVASNIAELKLLLKTVSTCCFVLSYSTVRDGGGGSYVLDAADTTSVDNGGTVIVANDGGRWKLNQVTAVSVKQFGAKGDGVTDDTAAFQAAVNTLAHLYIPVGNYVIGTVTISKELRIEGAGSTSSGAKITSSTLTGQVFNITSSGVWIQGLYFTAASQRTSGGYINITGPGGVVIQDLECWNAFDAYLVAGNSDVTLRRVRAYSTKNTVVTVSAGFNHTIDDLLADAPPGSQPVSGLYVTAVGDLTVSKAKLLHSGTALLVDVANGSYINSLVINQSFFDTSTRTGIIRSTGTGQIQRVDLTDDWFGSSSNQGLVITNSGTGKVDGINLTNVRANLNTGDGVQIDSNVLNVEINGGQFSQNSGSGISVGAGSQLQLIGGLVGTGGGFTANATGLFINASATGKVIGTKILGNTTQITNGNPNGFRLAETLGYVAENYGSFSGTTSTTGEMTVPHGLSAAPTFVDASIFEYGAIEAVLTSADATNIVVRLRNTNDNSPVASVPKTVRWTARI